MMKYLVFALVAIVASTSAGVVPVASFGVAPYATSYSAHTVNHAVATPFVAAAAPVVAASPPLVAASPLAAYSAYPHAAAYSAYPYASAYSTYPYYG